MRTNIFAKKNCLISSGCLEEAPQFRADPHNRCSYYQCVHTTSYGPLPCAPGTMVPLDYIGEGNPCTATRGAHDCNDVTGEDRVTMLLT